MGPRVKTSTFHEFSIQGGLGGAEQGVVASGGARLIPPWDPRDRF